MRPYTGWVRPRGAVGVRLAGLLVGVLIATMAAPVVARPAPDPRPAPAPATEPTDKRGTKLSIRLAAPLVALGEPVVAVVAVKPAARAVVEVQERIDGAWTSLGSARTDRRGQAVLDLDTSSTGSRELRAVLGAAGARGRAAEAISAVTTLTVLDPADCTPRIPLVDTEATPAARCLAARLDRWRSAGIMGMGQQLNVSSEDYADPLEELTGRRVSVVGFDLEELARTATYEYPFFDRAFADLVGLAGQGAVLTATWHMQNPGTGGSFYDRTWTDLERLLDETTPEGQRFWADADAKLALLAAFHDAGVAVVFRPLHEANGDWFWWGHPRPATYRKLWTRLQQRAWSAGVHNVLWGYSFNARSGKHIVKPVKLLPKKVDLAGIDSYALRSSAKPNKLPMGGYAAVAKRVKRMAITEGGPYDSRSGKWDPAALERAARAQKRAPLWSMLWFDDANGRKQLSSLRGGDAWLDSCPNAFCLLR